MRSNSVQKTINQRYSGQGLLMSTVPITNSLNCGICKEKYDSEHYPCIVCDNNHVACRKCIENQSGSKTNLNSTKPTEKTCPQCSQKFTRQTVRPFTQYYQLCEYIRRFQQISKKQQMRFQLKHIQSEQVNKLLKRQNSELKKWIKQVSEKLRQIEMGKKWNSTKANDFLFEIPAADVKNSQFQVIDGVIKKNSLGSFSNVIGLQPIPKTGVHAYTIKLLSSLSGGSIIYGLCTSQIKQQRFPWLSQGFIGYSGNDGDVISSGSWSNTSTLYYDGKKVRAGDEITTIVDMNSKMLNWKINGDFITESYVIPQQMRNKLLFPIVVLQDGDRIQIVQSRGK